MATDNIPHIGKEGFKVAAETSLENTKALLRNDMFFNVEGIADMCKERPVACTKFFSELIDREFNYEIEEDVFRVLEIGFSTTDNIGEVADFIYTTFSKDAPENDLVAKPKDLKRGRHKIDWSGDESPFSVGSKQHIAFGAILSCTETMKELKIQVKQALEDNDLLPKNIPQLICSTLRKAQERGWKYTKHGDGTMVLERIKQDTNEG